MDVKHRLKIHTFPFLLFFIIICLSGCTTNTSVESNTDFAGIIATVPNGIEITAKEGTISPEGLVLIIKNNSDKYSYSFGNDFSLENYKNGEWVEIPYINDGLSVTTIGYILEPNTKQEFEIYFKNTWGDLCEGNYRIVKYFEKTPENALNKVITCENYYYYFEIT